MAKMPMRTRTESGEAAAAPSRAQPAVDGPVTWLDYRTARAAWAGLSHKADGVYVADITVGELPWLRGHWLDRLPAIDADIVLLENRRPSAKLTNDRSK